MACKPIYFSGLYMNIQNTLFPIPECNKNDDETKNYKGKPKLNIPIRNQVEIMSFSIDDLIPLDHKARAVWAYANKLDLSTIISNIQSYQGNVGRSATDPRLLLSLWLYATIEGISCGRVIERYCKEHNGFKWLCGGVDVNYHTINDFRNGNKNSLNELLTQSVALFLSQNLIDLESISQDGIRVRANAGTSSFRRKPRLKEYLKIAKQHVEKLNKEREENTTNFIDHKKARELREAKDKENRIDRAIKELTKINAEKAESRKKHRQKLTQKEKKNLRASITDPEARKMKMANGGFSPAYNAQLATDTKTRIVVGVSVTNSGVDAGQMSLMQEQIIKRYNIKPVRWLCDNGYYDHEDIEKVKKLNQKCEILMPPRKPKEEKSYIPKRSDSEAVKEWRINMGKIESKEKYKIRASTAEWVNATARNRGLQQFVVRGLETVTSMMIIFGLTHNMVRAWNLGLN